MNNVDSNCCLERSGVPRTWGEDLSTRPRRHIGILHIFALDETIQLTKGCFDLDTNQLCNKAHEFLHPSFHSKTT